MKTGSRNKLLPFYIRQKLFQISTVTRSFRSTHRNQTTVTVGIDRHGG